MRRAKLGDVYCIKLSNGYKLFQWAYRIPRRGDYIRVFDGLYDTIPEDIEDIVKGPHSYIVCFFASRAYRIGLAQFIANYPIPKAYPFPDFGIQFWMNQTEEIISIWVMPNSIEITGSKNIMNFPVSSMEELPTEYQNLKLLNATPSPAWLLYLFDYNFNLSDLRRFWPQTVLGTAGEKQLDVYLNRVNELLKLDRRKRGCEK